MKEASRRSPRLLIVDGFAGPGEYAGGEPGSPLLILRALLGHESFERFATVQFTLLFIEHDPRRVDHLRAKVAEIPLPSNVDVVIDLAAFEEAFGRHVEQMQGAGGANIPTFAFIDPFGYSTASMSLAGKFLDYPRSEALFFLPLSFIHRFVGRQGQEVALTSLFNSDRWKDAIAMEGSERQTFLLDLFERQLRQQGQVEFVTSFRLRTRDGNDYRLVFATPHERGLELMKSAMWSVDPLQGTSYIARTESGQQVLFQPLVDTGPLLDQLRSTFQSRWFSVPQARKVTLATPYVAEKHLKRLTLVPAEKAGEIIVQRPDGCRAGSFTDGVRMRFASCAEDPPQNGHDQP
jgi:three-Cys-motif partner protein